MPRPRYAKLDATKQDRIIEAAKAEFAESGFERASYNKIIEAAGLSKGAMYYYFDDKLDLYVTVLEHVHHDMLRSIAAEGVMTEDGRWSIDGSFWSAVEAMLHSVWTYIASHPELAALAKPMRSFSREMRDSGRLSDLYGEWSQMLGELLRNGQQRGEVRDDLPFELLIEVTLSLDETLDFWLIEHRSDLVDNPVDHIVAIALDLMRRVLGPPLGGTHTAAPIS